MSICAFLLSPKTWHHQIIFAITKNRFETNRNFTVRRLESDISRFIFFANSNKKIQKVFKRINHAGIGIYRWWIWNTHRVDLHWCLFRKQIKIRLNWDIALIRTQINPSSTIQSILYDLVNYKTLFKLKPQIIRRCKDKKRKPKSLNFVKRSSWSS